MKKGFPVVLCVLAVFCFTGVVMAAEKAGAKPTAKPAVKAAEKPAAKAAEKPAEAKSGEALFKEHCTMCHADGGNIINPKKTLHKKDREANNILSEEDIVRVMRNPGPGMTAFDDKTISDKDAQEIAKHVIKTFN
jgi:cytochrome c6